MTNINTLLDKADRVYHQLMGHRPQLENLLCKVNEAAPEKPQVARGGKGRSGWNPGNAQPSLPDFFPSFLCQDDSGGSGGLSSTSASVNRYILQLAQEYCGDCKNSFDELSKIIQVIWATPKIIRVIPSVVWPAPSRLGQWLPEFPLNWPCPPLSTGWLLRSETFWCIQARLQSGMNMSASPRVPQSFRLCSLVWVVSREWSASVHVCAARFVQAVRKLDLCSCKWSAYVHSPTSRSLGSEQLVTQ